MGDEMGRTQRGNNNAYCQNNELYWVDWRLDDERRALLEWTSALIAFRAAHPVFRRVTFFSGVASTHGGAKDIVWLRPDGAEMTADDWTSPTSPSIAFVLNGSSSEGQDAADAPVADGTFAVMMNASPEPVVFRAPPATWRISLDTAQRSVGNTVADGAEVTLVARSVLVLERT
jgi:glycogen operon protein